MSYFRIGVVLFLFCFFSPLAHAEEITDYATDIFLQRDSTVHITETITYDFGAEEKHGIFRIIPLTIPDTPKYFWDERYISVSHVVITIDGKTVPYLLTSTHTTFTIKIGDAAQTIHGPHVYQISYDVVGSVVSFSDGEIGLYWNAVGPDWNVPVTHQVATVRAENGIMLGRNSCHSGPFGSDFSCTTTSLSNGFKFIPSIEGIGGGITIEQLVTSNEMTVVKLERVKIWWLVGGGLAGLVSIIFILWYRFKYKNRTSAPIIAEYEPYNGVLPMQAGYIMDERLDARDITAGVLYLAQQGNIKIERLPETFFGFDVSDHKLTFLKDVPEDPFLRRVIDLLFVGRPVGAVISLGVLKRDRDRAPYRYAAKKGLESALHDSLLTQGLFEQPYLTLLMWLIKFVWGPLFLLFFVFLFLDRFVPVPNYLLFGPIALAGVGAFFRTIFSERRSVAGYEAARNLQGFKLFLSVTGKDRFAFQSDPRNNPDIFMQYLPYAVAFGVEKEWAKVFADVTIPEPSWYQSSTGTAFNAVALTSSLDTFSSNFSSSMRSASTVHSNGGGSGSFGGGFSGGGGGGGGGGSW